VVLDNARIHRESELLEILSWLTDKS
jgi:hypothetical protein